MAYLFIVENQAVLPTPEVLTIYPFKEIWERDKTKDKENALAEFKYIEFMTSAKRTNPYKGYDDNVRETKVRQAVNFSNSRKIDKLMEEGMEVIRNFQTEASETYTYWLSAKKAVAKMKTFNNTFDLNAVNPKTLNLMLKPKDITNALKDTEAVLANLSKLEKKVEEDLYSAAKVRSDKKISPFARKDSFT